MDKNQFKSISIHVLKKLSAPKLHMSHTWTFKLGLATSRRVDSLKSLKQDTPERNESKSTSTVHMMNHSILRILTMFCFKSSYNIYMLLVLRNRERIEKANN